MKAMENIIYIGKGKSLSVLHPNPGNENQLMYVFATLRRISYWLLKAVWAFRFHLSLKLVPILTAE